MRTRQWVAATVAVGVLLSSTTSTAALLTDITVFSSNSDGHNWNGLIWNTQGRDTDTDANGGPGKWNLYISYDPVTAAPPTFINSYNNSSTRILLSLAPGSHTFTIFGNGVGRVFDPVDQYFVLNLYFDSVQSAPAISGVQNLSNTNLQPAGSPMGFGVFGEIQPGANTLSALINNQLITLTAFSWVTGDQRDVVYPYHANDPPYSNGGEGADYYGSFTLSVRSVPEPVTIALLGLGLAGLAASRRRKQ